MSFLVTDSETPLQAETLPALKITHFFGTPARGAVYAYLRCYVYQGDVHYSVCVFDELPPPSARVGFAITADDTLSRYLFLSISKNNEPSLSLYHHDLNRVDAVSQTLAVPEVQKFSGADEQGGYWGAQGVLPHALWKSLFNCTPKAGVFLPANVFLYDIFESAFGAAFPVPKDAVIPTADGFSPFMIVPY